MSLLVLAFSPPLLWSGFAGWFETEADRLYRYSLCCSILSPAPKFHFTRAETWDSPTLFKT